ncbi:CLUMA_CG017807, isoform A [Clunio marinus]|uniref:CLUMA_CG017807, isoform A n=1 Tax=Clunio marinus TaxID=568069 RepID=A0A1J1IWT6_9DIPT|nr:CLUMA_CG017807, isoform A [Clunio marinus]
MIKVDETDPVGDIELKFPYRQVSVKRGEDVKKFYDLSEEIGRGKFGTVYKCKEKSTGLCSAAKFIAVPNRKERKNVEREIEMMNRLQHPKIIQLYDAFEYNKMVCVVLELVDGGELFDRVLDDKFILTEKACSIFMRQICEAMDYIHEHNIIHLDLKATREYDPSTKLQVLFGTPEFVAPEVVNFDAITFATDMWSVGVIAYVLVSGLSPFAGECDVETMGNVTVGKYDFNDEAFDNVSPECIDFITKLLVKQHGERLTAKEALRHKWVKRKPQYHSTNVKPSTSPLSLKSVYSDKDNSLTSAKDNLRNCVDRWNDSTPYVFDKHTKSISSVHSSISSSIELSPSFAEGSLSNSSESLTTPDDNDLTNSLSSPENINIINDENNKSSSLKLTELSPHHNEIINIKDYLHILDRHKSIDNCFLSPSSCERLLNIEKFTKLTNHLFDKNVQAEPTPQTNGDERNYEIQTTDDIIINNNNGIHDINIENLSTKQTTSSVDLATKANMLDKSDDGGVKKGDRMDENNNKINDFNGTVIVQENGINNERSHPFSEIFKKFSSLHSVDSQVNDSSNAPWPVSTKRTKFRINQMSSRDVPIVRIEKPAKLKKQNAIDACDTKIFDEKINHTKSIIYKTPGTLNNNCIVDILKSFEHDREQLFQSHFRHKTFIDRMPNGSISFDCGQIDVEQRSINTISSLFKLHATTGRQVKQIQARIEANNK